MMTPGRGTRKASPDRPGTNAFRAVRHRAGTAGEARLAALSRLGDRQEAVIRGEREEDAPLQLVAIEEPQETSELPVEPQERVEVLLRFGAVAVRDVVVARER